MLSYVHVYGQAGRTNHPLTRRMTDAIQRLIMVKYFLSSFCVTHVGSWTVIGISRGGGGGGGNYVEPIVL